MELKISQDLASINHHPLLLVFLDLRKAYDMVDHGSLIRTLKKYGAGSHMCKILANLWSHQEVITR